MKILPIILLGVVLASSGCSRTAHIQNVYNTPTPHGASNLSHQQVHDIIISALGKRYWTCHSLSSNILRCEHKVRAHRAIVDVQYSPFKYSITHVGSSGMREQGHSIHAKYNKWIHRMKQDIDKALAAAGKCRG